MYAKLSKCEFCLKSVAFVGQIVSGEGIKVNNQKIEAVDSCPRPTSLTDVRSFLSFAGYYRRFFRWVFINRVYFNQVESENN